MMESNEQAGSYGVTLSEAKGLAQGAQRCFASLSMTTPDRSWVLHFIISPLRTRCRKVSSHVRRGQDERGIAGAS